MDVEIDEKLYSFTIIADILFDYSWFFFFGEEGNNGKDDNCWQRNEKAIKQAMKMFV